MPDQPPWAMRAARAIMDALELRGPDIDRIASPFARIILREHDKESAKGRARMTHKARAARRRAIAQAVHEGAKVAVAATEYDVSLVTARHACQEFGVIVPRSPYPRMLNCLQILSELLVAGQTQAAIGAKANVTQQYVSLVAKQAKDAGIALPQESPNGQG